MCSTHWPKLVDLTRDEAKRVLRRIELEAYASVVTALRSQGDLTVDKKKLLQDLQATLSISLERHKAEVRRAVNDEKLTTIADHMSGSNVSSEWLIEGRRLVPLMPRLVPQTAFTATANTAANAQAEKNINLPLPANTGKDIYAPPPPCSSNATPTQLKTTGQPQSPPSNVVHLPSGMSIHIKGEIKEEDSSVGGRRSSLSQVATGVPQELVIVTRPSMSVSPPLGLSSGTSDSSATTTATAQPLTNSPPIRPPTHTNQQPMRVTVTKSPVKAGPSSLTSGTTGKLVVMSATGNSNNSNILTTTSVAFPVSHPVISYPHPKPLMSALPSRPHTMASTQFGAQRPALTASSVSYQSVPATTTPLVSGMTVVSSVPSSGASTFSSLQSVPSMGNPLVSGMTGVSSFPSSGASTFAAPGHAGIEVMKSVPMTSLPTPAHSPMAGVTATTVLSSTPHLITTHRSAYPRTRTIITRPRGPLYTPQNLPHQGGTQRSTIVIPAASGGATGQTMSGVMAGHQHHPQVIRTSGPRPAIHIKQEGSMKIITQAVPGSVGSKVITKPASSASPVVVITTGASSLATRPSAPTGSKILNISSGGTRVITATRQTAGNVVTVNPKSFHLTTVKASPSQTALTSTGSKLTTAPGSKPNVIVVQKAGTHSQKKLMTAISQTPKSAAPSGTIQVVTSINQTPGSAPKAAVQVMTAVSQTPGSAHQQGAGLPKTPPAGAIQSPFEKELVSFIQKQDSHNRQVLSQQQRNERRLAPKAELQAMNHPTAKKITVVRQKADGSTTSQPIVITQGAAGQSHAGSKSSILAELINAVNHPATQKHQPEGGDVMLLEEQQAVSSITKHMDSPDGGGLLQNQWVEMDAPLTPQTHTEPQQPSSSDTSAIKALLDLQQGHRLKVTKSYDTAVTAASSVQREMQMPHSEIITIDQSGNIVQQLVQHDGGAGISMETGVQYGQQKRVGEFVGEGSAPPLRIEVSTEEELAQMENVVSQEIIGELDPNTGILYTNSPLEGQHMINTGTISSITPLYPSHQRSGRPTEAGTQPPRVVATGYAPPQMVTVSTAGEETKEIAESYQEVTEEAISAAAAERGGDFLTTVLDQADIQLDPAYQYVTEMEQPQEVNPSTALHNTRLGLNPSDGHQEASVLQVIPSTQEVSVSIQSRMPDVIADVLPPQHAPGGQHLRLPPSVQVIQTLGAVQQPPTAAVVAVETSPGMDPTSLQLRDLTSQNLEGEASYLSEEHASLDQQSDLLASPSAGSSQDGLSDSFNKRKRKPPLHPDELLLDMSGWARIALGLVHKVSKYRGVYKQKGEINASSWFTQPVNASEVPDYYAIIETPMDFSTIKKKIEMNLYRDLSDFHGDMMLVRDNCYQYNEEGSEVRRDCDEVFAFYLAEYDKALQRWQQSQVVSPTSKKPRLDRSPVHQQTPP